MPQNAIPSCCLTPDQKESLIKAVHDRPAIWDTGSDEYNDAAQRRKAYEEVAEILSVGNQKYRAPEVQVEWKKLRDVFNRTLKKAATGNMSEVCWRYWNEMKFIATPEQLASLKIKSTEKPEQSTQPTVDIYGLRRLLERTARGNSEESAFEGEEDDGIENETQPLSFEWIAAQCAARSAETEDAETNQQHESTDGDSAVAAPNGESSSYEEPIGLSDLTTTSPLPKRRRLYQKPRTAITPLIANTKADGDTFDAFGAYVATQLRAISKRNRFTGVVMKRELIELCFKYELENI
ncbi:hypothetical protein M3Y98_00820500 [Aphelenchoides besseyi]|nr:hypothetical protein M3Y98_00820500 [Aphelenchoides besseyi]KAI6212214.1 hypothetical protein M3Y96_00516700 [Aphelenchoides besseyi]